MDVPKTRDGRYVATLAVVAGFILVGGWLARPRDISRNAAPPPSATELQQLARRVQRRSLESMTDYLAAIAGEVHPSSVQIGGTGINGLVWEARRIIVPPLQPRLVSEPLTVASASGHAAGQVTMSGPNLPLAAVTIARGPGGLPPVHRAASQPRSGDWLLAVWRTDTGPVFASGNFLEQAGAACNGMSVQEVASSVPLTRRMLGGGLFNIEGGLLAVILPCRERITTVAITSIDMMLDRGNTVEQRILGRFGLALGPLTVKEAQYFKPADGLLVRETWPDYPADLAGLRPGDIITAIDGEPLTTLADLPTRSEVPLGLTIQRQNRRLTLDLPAAADQARAERGDGAAGVRVESSSATYTFERVSPGSRMAVAGIEPGDRLIRIDQREPRSLRQVRRIAAGRSSPIWVEVDRDGRRLGVLVD